MQNTKHPDGYAGIHCWMERHFWMLSFFSYVRNGRIMSESDSDRDLRKDLRSDEDSIARLLCKVSSGFGAVSSGKC